MTFEEAKKHLARKLNIDYSDLSNNDLFTDTDLNEWINQGVKKAWDYKPWPFTQRVKKATTISAQYYDHPTDIMNGSIYRLVVGGEEYKKVIAQDYFKFFEDYPTATDKIWTELETYIFINQNAYTVGDEMCLFGKRFYAALSSSSDLLPFSPTTDNYEHSGNEAIVLLGYAEALSSEKKKMYAEAEGERKKAYETLNVLWQPFAESKSYLQSKGRPMFNTHDFFGGSAQARSSQYTGNFDYLN